MKLRRNGQHHTRSILGLFLYHTPAPYYPISQDMLLVSGWLRSPQTPLSGKTFVLGNVGGGWVGGRRGAGTKLGLPVAATMHLSRPGSEQRFFLHGGINRWQDLQPSQIGPPSPTFWPGVGRLRIHRFGATYDNHWDRYKRSFGVSMRTYKPTGTPTQTTKLASPSAILGPSQAHVAIGAMDGKPILPNVAMMHRSRPRSGCTVFFYMDPLTYGTILNLHQPPPTHTRRSRSSAVMHVTPELEVLGSNPGGVGTQCPRR